MKIALINQYAGGPAYGMEYRPHHLAVEWRRLGHQVVIVGGTYSHLRIRNPIAKPPQTPETVEGVKMVWLPVPAYQGNGISRARNILTFAGRLIATSRALAKEFAPDVVITSSTHPLDIYGGRRLARLTGARLIHEVHDLWPLTLIELGSFPQWHPFIVLLQAAEDHAYRIADRVVSILPDALPYMRRHGLDPERFTYVPNGVVVEDWRNPEPLPTQHTTELNRIKASSGFVVGYAGSFSLSYDLDTFLASMERLARKDIYFVLVGDGPLRQDLEHRYASARIRFLSPIRKAAVPSLLARFDACFLGYKRSPLWRFGVNPNKMFDYMMASKPIIFGIETAQNLVTDSGAGLSVPPQTPSAIARAIERLAAESDEERAERGASGKRYVLEHHDYRVLARQFLNGII